MNNERPIEYKGKWIFQLHQEQNLQFRITSEQGADNHILIEGHEISVLLDYLYEHRDLIYEATHNQEMRLLEAQTEGHILIDTVEEKTRVAPTLYFDDGLTRTKATS